MRASLIPLVIPGIALLSACSDSSGPAQTVPQCTAAEASGNVVPLDPFEARTFRGSELNRCVWVTGIGATYLVVPQFATSSAPRQLTRYLIGTGGTQTAAAPLVARAHVSRSTSFENALRRRERKLAREAEPARRTRTEPSFSTRSVPAPRLQQVGDTRTFRVLSSIPENENAEPTYATVTASIRFVGANILIYVDQQAPTGANGLSDQVLQDLGIWFDRDLYPIGVSTFGPESDIDQNGRVIVLMTPVVNGLTPRNDCSVAVFGFFFGGDLLDVPNSNKSEVFYSLVPDPQAQFGCARSVQRVEESVPTVFIHEFQHMISFNHHVLINRGPDEETWLDEGLAHMAEEVVARHYENKGPAPVPPRLFNDTANIFISANLTNSYSYLERTATSSITLFESTGTLEERGAAWLFLRWLADLKDSTVFRRLVQNDAAGIANVAAVAGEPFDVLFGDFALALWTDSIPGHLRASVPARNRFKSRNLRQLYARLNEVSPTQFPHVFPLEARPLPFGMTLQSSMLPGAMEYFVSESQPADPAIGFRFARDNGATFAPAMKAQLGVFRLP
ncbi:MAG: hypothetical protein ACT4PJ_04730 [Gemmatimonadaceae bacterium]